MRSELLSFDLSSPLGTKLNAGDLCCLYEDGCLRYIKYKNTELVRMIYPAVRDTRWNTIIPTISNEKIVKNENSFSITYTAYYQADDIRYESNFTIEGTPDGSLSYTMNGIALASFLVNRIGLCVHLPVKECKGKKVLITDGRSVEGRYRFPDHISPQQPFSQIQKMQWSHVQGQRIVLYFDGEIFEAEDQRNWMDHSFKIYGRPLSSPFPYTVDYRNTLQQTISMKLTLENSLGESPQNLREEKNINRTVPAIGIASANDGKLLTEREKKLLHHICLDHYRAEIDFAENWRVQLSTAASNALLLQTSLHLVLFFTDNYMEEAYAFIDGIISFHHMIIAILPLHTYHKVTPLFLQQIVYPLLKKSYPEIQTGYGTDAYFAELNRHPPGNNYYDFVSFSLNPQVHSVDTNTILENLQTLPDIIHTVRSFTQKPIYVSPVTFRKRRNHDAAGNNPALIEHADKRLHTTFGAGWFLLCLYYLQGVTSATFFATTGDSGIIQVEEYRSTALYRTMSRVISFAPISIKKVICENNIHIIFENKQQATLSFILEGFPCCE